MHYKGGSNPPPPVDYTGALIAQAKEQTTQMQFWTGAQVQQTQLQTDARVRETEMLTDARVQQTQMQTSMMQILGAQNLMAQQERLDAKLEIATMNFEAKLEQMRLDARQNQIDSANRHIETLARNDEIELDSADYQGGYPYQYG